MVSRIYTRGQMSSLSQNKTCSLRIATLFIFNHRRAESLSDSSMYIWGLGFYCSFLLIWKYFDIFTSLEMKKIMLWIGLISFLSKYLWMISKFPSGSIKKRVFFLYWTLVQKDLKHRLHIHYSCGNLSAIILNSWLFALSDSLWTWWII